MISNFFDLYHVELIVHLCYILDTVSALTRDLPKHYRRAFPAAGQPPITALPLTRAKPLGSPNIIASLLPFLFPHLFLEPSFPLHL